MWLFYYFNFERNYDVLKSKNPCILWNKNINFNKNQKESKIPHTVLERRTLCFSSYKNRKLKVKLSWVGPREKSKRTSFAPFILSKGNFLTFVFYLDVWYIEYIWLNRYYNGILIFGILKTLLHTHFCLFLKSPKAFSVSLKWTQKKDFYYVLFANKFFTAQQFKS